ncbi:hypothetical protein GXP67_05045 [Rhodocytophaga rosea]|uniref:Uncharacterized protein n=1 Tax=Rhodocytophaga rosea TaxID=2704465 RepID=A0A6C0GDS8_9BACT|nr:hypothetical protein [Rhodocytophaga rosea]QHT66077.1 hypothetical protein GXP67_05045 [Rhodocytophaga rosea]
MEEVEKLLAERADKLLFYSPYSFIREIGPEIQYEKLIKNKIIDFSDKPDHIIQEVVVGNYTQQFLVNYLSWDAGYFQIPTYRIFAVLYRHKHFPILSQAVTCFRNTFIAGKRKYCFIEIPSEDSLLLQAFTHAGFKLIETRLTYYLPDVQSYENERFPVHKANENDVSALKKVAAEARNPYDRIHADSIFTQEIADQYLATYIEQAINGFADAVLVPSEEQIPAHAFVALSYLANDSKELNCQLSRILLTAVDPSSRGWHYKLISEAVYQSKSVGAKYLLMTTQTTNRAVIRNCEKLGFRLGSSTHILSAYNQD